MGQTVGSDVALQGAYFDTLHLAGQLGRLDFASLLLAIVAVLMALGGVIAFLDIRRTAKTIAEEVSEKIAKAVAERIAVEHVQKELPKIFEEHSDLLMPVETADAIARAQENGEGRG